MTRSRKSAAASAQILLPWWELIVLSLLLSRFYLPAEASDRGMTLWLAAASFLLLAVGMWRNWRHAEPISCRRPNLPEWGLILLVGGHLVSAAHAAWIGGNSRTILNLAWEWGAIAAMLLLLRRCMCSAAFRQLLTPSLLTVAVTLSLLGCWQHFVWFPSNAQMAQRLQQLDDQGRLTDDERTERDRLIAQVPEWGSTSETGRQMLFARLAASREPIATFALANTFAGLLVVLLLLAVDQTFSLWNAGHWRWLLLGLLALTAYCLLLTKARTGYAAAAAGLIVWGGFQLWHSQSIRRSQLVKVLLIGIGLVVLGLVIAFGSGSLDRQVVTESFKSFRYRIEYWTATLQLLRDHPIFGTGPGNFRPMYLHYKLPGSSEEILDPHNLVLELWASGGLLALTGAGLIVVSLARSVFQQQETAASSLPVTAPAEYPLGFRTACGVLPILVVWLGRGALDGWLDPTLGWLLLVSAIVSPLLVSCCQNTQFAGWLAAWVALTLHLCGAGGIGMPAIIQLWLLVWMACLWEPQVATASKASTSPLDERLWQGGIVAALGLTFGCLWTGVIPVTSGDQLLAQARIAQQTDLRLATRLSTLATQADSLSPEPWQELALVHVGQWRQSPRWNTEHMTQAIEAQQFAIARDPQAGKRYHLLGQIWGMKFAESHEATDAEQGIAVYRAGTAHYPNYAPLHADLAVLLRDTNQSAVAEAQRAVELDDLNQAAGHVDKLLPKTQRESLEEIVAAGKSPS